MPRVSVLQNAFNQGEWSPFVDARSDLQKYLRATSLMKNWVPLVQGPAQVRPGFNFVARTKDSTETARLLEFEFSTTQAYVIEAGDLYFRFFSNNGSIVEAAKTITGASQADPCNLTIVGHGYSVDDEIVVEAVGGMTELNDKRYKVNSVPGVDNITLKNQDGNTIDSTSFTAYTTGGTAKLIHEVVTPYLQADLFELKIAQSADVLYIVHPGYASRKLIRTNDTSWSLDIIDFQDGPYLSTNTTDTTLNPAAATGTGINVVASATDGINDGDGFKSTDVGRLIRMKHSSTWGYAKIVTFNSTTSVDVDIINDFGAATAVTDWRLGVWSDTTGYPGAVTFYEDRLWFGGATEYPQRIDGSRTGDYENFAPSDTDGTVADDHGVAFTLNANNVNVVRWLIDDEKGLLVGTVGGEWVVRATTTNEVITPTNIKAARSSTEGSANIAAVRANQAVLFVQRAKKRLRELAYRFEDDGFRAPDMTVLAEHITSPGMVELAFQQQPYDVLWAPRSDGVLLGFTYERDQDVTGWHQHQIGGTNAKVESIAVIPDPTGTRDELWALTSRTVNGATVRFVEYMNKFWEEDDDVTDAIILDAALTYDSTPTTTISNLDHLEGETVTVLVDGATHPTKVVTNGSITLDLSGSTVQVGLGYNADIKLHKPDAGSREGTAQMKEKRVHNVVVRFWNSVNLLVGPDENTLDRIIFRSAADLMGVAVPPFTGDKRISPNTTTDTAGEIFLRQDQPLPCTIVAVMTEMDTVDD